MLDLNLTITFEQAVKETGQRFRETILALGGGKAPLEVCFVWSSFLAYPLGHRRVLVSF